MNITRVVSRTNTGINNWEGEPSLKGKRFNIKTVLLSMQWALKYREQENLELVTVTVFPKQLLIGSHAVHMFYAYFPFLF